MGWSLNQEDPNTTPTHKTWTQKWIEAQQQKKNPNTILTHTQKMNLYKMDWNSRTKKTQKPFLQKGPWICSCRRSKETEIVLWLIDIIIRRNGSMREVWMCNQQYSKPLTLQVLWEVTRWSSWLQDKRPWCLRKMEGDNRDLFIIPCRGAYLLFLEGNPRERFARRGHLDQWKRPPPPPRNPPPPCCCCCSEKEPSKSRFWGEWWSRQLQVFARYDRIADSK